MIKLAHNVYNNHSPQKNIKIHGEEENPELKDLKWTTGTCIGMCDLLPLSCRTVKCQETISTGEK